MKAISFPIFFKQSPVNLCVYVSVNFAMRCLNHLIIYEFKVYRKKAITIITSVFKDFLHIAHSICHEKYIKKEEKLLIMFVENDHNKQLSKKLVIQYSNKNNKSTNTTNTQNHKNNTKNRNYTNLKKLSWISNTCP